MDFLKKHYEKVLLGAVLLGLAVAVGFLFFKIASEKTELQLKADELKQPRIKELTNLDLTPFEAVFQRLGLPAAVDFAAPHKVFNPMPWQKTTDGRLIKVNADNVGPRAVVVTKLTPLCLELSLDSIFVEGPTPRFVIGVKREAAATAKERIKTGRYCELGQKTDLFVVREVGGPPDSPTNVVLELNDTHERAVIAKEHPFQRTDAYMADLKYPPENRTWSNLRANMPPPLSFNGEVYDVVAITQSEVTLKAKSNQKKWPIPYNPSPPK